MILWTILILWCMFLFFAIVLSEIKDHLRWKHNGEDWGNKWYR